MKTLKNVNAIKNAVQAPKPAEIATLFPMLVVPAQGLQPESSGRNSFTQSQHKHVSVCVQRLRLLKGVSRTGNPPWQPDVGLQVYLLLRQVSARSLPGPMTASNRAPGCRHRALAVTCSGLSIVFIHTSYRQHIEGVDTHMLPAINIAHHSCPVLHK